MSPSTNGTINQERNQCEALLTACFTLISYLAYSSALMMEAICSSDAPVNLNGLHGVITLKIEYLKEI
jgi:hypothetical protein